MSGVKGRANFKHGSKNPTKPGPKELADVLVIRFQAVQDAASCRQRS